MNKNLRNINPLTKSQWIGFCVLLTIVLVMILGLWVADLIMRPVTDDGQLRLSTETAGLLEESLKAKRKNTYYKPIKADTVPLCLHLFDPNNADSVELLQLGFQPWMARNVIKYRQKGGMFRTKESLRRIYGMSEDLYTQIEPYIVIVFPESTIISVDTLHYPVKKDTILELNTADTAQLQILRGIGRYTALQIVRYRNQLGGYVSPEQLSEIKELNGRADSLKICFTANPALITPLSVNHASLERLQRHPYLSFTQAQALYELRRRNFRLESMDDLQKLEEFSDEDIHRLKPYLSFER